MNHTKEFKNFTVFEGLVTDVQEIDKYLYFNINLKAGDEITRIYSRYEIPTHGIKCPVFEGALGLCTGFLINMELECNSCGLKHQDVVYNVINFKRFSVIK